MAGVMTIPWRTEDYLETVDEIAVYLDAVFEDAIANSSRMR